MIVITMITMIMIIMIDMKMLQGRPGGQNDNSDDHTSCVIVALVFIFISKHTQVIAAEGEQKASRALREAAEVIAESPSALQLRSELHTVENFH